MGSALEIRSLPDPVLRQVCTPVTDFGEPLATLARQMLDTMYAATGRGLAAPQVGIAQRLFVMDVTWKEGTPAPMILVNPVISGRSDTLVTREEGCLSIPVRTSLVTRPDRVWVSWRGVDGAQQEADFSGFAATCIQHEVDHLDGVLCIDREEQA